MNEISDIRAELLRLQKSAAEGGESLSNQDIARGIGKSSATISLYLAGKYAGDNASIEIAVLEWLRDRNVSKVSGVATIENDVSRSIAKRLEEIRSSGELGLVIGPAGIGKSRGEGLYLRTHTLAISFRSLPWRSGMNAVAEDLSNGAGIHRLARGEKRWDKIIEATKDSGRLLVVDDAHELAPRALQCCVDYHDQTGNPVALTGLPLLRKKLLADARRARRVGDVFEVVCKDPEPLVNHLIDQLAPDCNGDRPDLLKLCLQVARNSGAFGAVEKQLKHAARARKKVSSVTWPEAFRAAQKRLLRQYELDK